MKRSKLLCIACGFLAVSCNPSHYHDGKYSGLVFDGGSWTNMHQEVLTIEGDEIVVEKYTLIGSPAGTTKVPCNQFHDRIEVQDEKTVKVLTLTKEQSLRLNADIVYKKIANDSMVTQKEPMPLIKKKGNRLYF